jgi:nucleotide-binding universal stress UspA family protein
MPYPWRRVLVPTDFSTAAAWAFDDAIRMAAATAAELVIVHVRMTRPTNPAELRFPGEPGLYDYAERHELETLRQRVERHDVELRTRLLVRHASEAGAEICRTAVDEEADLIVIATHARHHVAHWIIGSTTLAVACDSRVPVLSVRYGVQKRKALRKIVVPAGIGQAADGAAALAAAIAAHEGAEIHLISIADRGAEAAAGALLDELATRAIPGVPAMKRILGGSDAEREILRYCDDSGADMLAISRRVERDQGVIRKSAVPVLLVP